MDIFVSQKAEGRYFVQGHLGTDLVLSPVQDLALLMLSMVQEPVEPISAKHPLNGSTKLVSTSFFFQNGDQTMSIKN